MNSLLLLSTDDTLIKMVQKLVSYAVHVKSAFETVTTHYYIILCDISSVESIDQTVVHQLLQCSDRLLIIADAHEQEQLAQYEAAFDFLIKPLHEIVLYKRLESMQIQDKTTDSYLRFIRHELKNPLAAIAGYTSLMLDSADDPQMQAKMGSLTARQLKFLRAIGTNAEKIQAIIDDLQQETQDKIGT